MHDWYTLSQHALDVGRQRIEVVVLENAAAVGKMNCSKTRLLQHVDEPLAVSRVSVRSTETVYFKTLVVNEIVIKKG